MPKFEYKVVPAPTRGQKIKGVKTTQERFAHVLATLMNDLGRDGWEYQRADTLPCEERQGLTGKTTTFQNMLIFRRALPEQAAPAPMPQAEEAPKTPEEIAARAAASLTADAPEGKAPPALTTRPEGRAPLLGPARLTEDPEKKTGDVAAE
ncbi:MULTISPECIES: DUF4177 domain-containing protein [Actibacterium]|uniref:DUF4177 domain-containing protein n=1 Tax=Actibacterium naphthalenivorans TaxID=1614693 RepID=A0A840C5T1_9RHOB|nr:MULTISPECIES: DUF4177 domain-containing protein [Actibacterium]MBB4020430.1 hypothetical protein [Actibacterium naphthalenivorans]